MNDKITLSENPPWHQIPLLDEIFLDYKLEKKKTCALILRKAGMAFDLISLLPPDHHFSHDHSFGYDDTKRSIHLDLFAIKRDPREFFAVLHEIGHAVVDDRKGAEYVQQSKKAPKLSRDYEITYSNLTVADERNAWAEAIRAARTLRKNGFDLSGLFESSDDLMGWLRSTGLRRYEANSRTRVSKEWLTELFEKNELQRRNTKAGL